MYCRCYGISSMRSQQGHAIIFALWFMCQGNASYGATDCLGDVPLSIPKGGSVNRPTPICVASAYLLYDLGDLGGGNIWVNHISNDKTIVGSSYDTNGTTRPCVWEFKDNVFTIEAIGSSAGTATGMNDMGVIAGTVSFNNGSHAGSWSRAAGDTNWTPASYANLGGPYSGLAAINNEGIAVGWANDSRPSLRGATWKDDNILDLGSGEARAINERSEVVGFHYDNGPKHACLWRIASNVTERTDLPLAAGATSSEAISINASGRIVGNQYYSNVLNSRACSWSCTNDLFEAHDLESLGGTNSKAYDINNRGQIVGYGQDASGTYCAAIWEQGAAVNLNDVLPDSCDWELILAASINDQGAIIGRASTHGVYKSFLLSPRALLQLEIQHLPGQLSLSWPALGTGFVYGVEYLDQGGLWQMLLLDGNSNITNDNCLIPTVNDASNRWFRLNVHNHDE